MKTCLQEKGGFGYTAPERPQTSVDIVYPLHKQSSGRGYKEHMKLEGNHNRGSKREGGGKRMGVDLIKIHHMLL